MPNTFLLSAVRLGLNVDMLELNAGCIVEYNSPCYVYVAIYLAEESCYHINPAQTWHLFSWLISVSVILLQIVPCQSIN